MSIFSVLTAFLHKRESATRDDYYFHCPGCDGTHQFTVRKGADAGIKPNWSFDGNREAPSFEPSLLYPRSPGRCHLHLTAGKIRFYPDCDHALKGQTVDMVPLEPPADGS